MKMVKEWTLTWDFFAETHYPGRTQVFLDLDGQRRVLCTIGGDARPPKGSAFKLQLVVVPEEKEG